MIDVKICGLSTAETLEAALQAGADWVGFVRFPRSPRHVEDVTARRLSDQARGRAGRVLLLVDPDDAAVEAAVAAVDPDLIQLHGRETPDRVRAIRIRTGRPVMKAVAIGGREDVAGIAAYSGAADRLLLDAKPHAGASLPGGNGVRFDWDLLRGVDLPPATMLSGGLDAGTVAQALAATGLTAVDVSSGVESAPGIKDAGRIAAFVAAARGRSPGAADASMPFSAGG